MIKAIILSIFLLFSFSRCTKDSSESRRTGNGTISCYINGKLWQNSESTKTTGGIISNSMSVNTNSKREYFSFFGRKWGDSKLYLMMVEDRKSTGDTYLLDDSQGIMDFALDTREYNTIVFFNDKGKYLSKSDQGWIKKVEFTDNVVNNIFLYKGTFEATLYHENDPTDIIYITDGQFHRHTLDE